MWASEERYKSQQLTAPITKQLWILADSLTCTVLGSSGLRGEDGKGRGGSAGRGQDMGRIEGKDKEQRGDKAGLRGLLQGTNICIQIPRQLGAAGMS